MYRTSSYLLKNANIYKSFFSYIVMKRIREEIIRKILYSLEEKPSSIQEISKKVGSNWSTTNEILEELKKDRKVREIVSTEKIRLFKLARDDTYLDIPISNKGKQIGFYLFNKIKKEWAKKMGKPPMNTDVLKVAVDVLEKTNLSRELPTVWYLFGKIPILKYSPEVDYPISDIEDSGRIDKEVSVSIKAFSTKRTVYERMLQQYETYNNELYKSKEKIRDMLNKNLDDEKILKELENEIAKFYFCIPTKDDASGIAMIVHEFIILLEKMILSLKKLDRFKKEITDAFASIWELVAIYMFFDSLGSYEQFKNREDLRFIYFENSIQYRISNAKDFLSQLNSIYLNNLDNLPEKMNYSKEAEAVRNMFFEMGIEKEK